MRRRFDCTPLEAWELLWSGPAHVSSVGLRKTRGRGLGAEDVGRTGSRLGCSRQCDICASSPPRDTLRIYGVDCRGKIMNVHVSVMCLVSTDSATPALRLVSCLIASLAELYLPSLAFVQYKAIQVSPRPDVNRPTSSRQVIDTSDLSSNPSYSRHVVS